MRVVDFGRDVTGHRAPVTGVAFDPSGRLLASCSYDGSVLLWDVTTAQNPELVGRLRHRRLVNSMCWNPADGSLLATASADKTAAVWRVRAHEEPQLVSVLARHTDDVNAVAWTPDGERLVCVSEDGRVSLWNARSAALIGELGAHTAHCMAVAINGDGLIATVGEDGLVSVGHPDDRSAAATRSYPSSVEGCAWSRSGKLLAIARDDGVVDLLHPDLSVQISIQVSSVAARSVAFTDDDSAVVVGAYDGRVHVLGVDGELVRWFQDARFWPRSVATHGGIVAVGSFWSRPHLLELATGRDLTGGHEPTHGPNALAVRGEDLIIGCDSGAVLVTDPSGRADAGPPRVVQVAESPILSLAVHGDLVYAGTYSGHVVAHRLDQISGESTAAQVSSVPLGAPVPSLTCVDGRIVAGTYNGDLIALDPATLAISDSGPAHGGSVKALAAFGDGFLSASTDRTVAVGTLTDRQVLWDHGNLVNDVATLGGQVVASAGRDHTVRVARLAPAGDGRWQVVEQHTLLGPDESVKCVGLLGTPEAPVVLAGSYDFGLHLWQVRWGRTADGLVNGRLLSEFRQGLSCIAALSPDLLAVASWDGRIALVGTDHDGRVRVRSLMDVEDLVSQRGQLAEVTR